MNPLHFPGSRILFIHLFIYFAGEPNQPQSPVRSETWSLHLLFPDPFSPSPAFRGGGDPLLPREEEEDEEEAGGGGHGPAAGTAPGAGSRSPQAPSPRSPRPPRWEPCRTAACPNQPASGGPFPGCWGRAAWPQGCVSRAGVMGKRGLSARLLEGDSPKKRRFPFGKPPRHRPGRLRFQGVTIYKRSAGIRPGWLQLSLYPPSPSM